MPSRSRPVALRAILPEDLGPLMLSVGPLVDDLYPGGAGRLLSRLEDALAGYASATLAVSTFTGRPVGLASEVSKGRAVTKLSTFWVHPLMRRRGVGSALLRARIFDWERQDLSSVHVTVRADRAPELESLFLPNGFERVALEVGRYGDGRDEVVLQWRPGHLVERVA